MTAPLKKPATYDDVLALPPHITGQIVDGELFTRPRPTIRHAHVDPALRTLEAFRLQRGLWLEIGAWGNDDKPRVEPFDAIELSLAEWWLPADEGGGLGPHT